MPRIFISYRRQDSEHITGRIFDRLEPHFGRDNVFIDINTIPFGVDFRKHLDQAVSQCDVFLAIIGEQWLEVRHEEGPNQGQRRLDDPKDFVRIEIDSALTRDIPVIPVLVGNARMPCAQALPKALRGLASRQAAEVQSGRDFRDHVDRLIRGIDFLLSGGQEPGKEQRQLEEGETSLVQRLREILDRSGGAKLTAGDSSVLGKLCKEYGISEERAKAILREERTRWNTTHPTKPEPKPETPAPKKERQPGAVEALDLGGGVSIPFAWVPAGTFFKGGGGGKPGDKQVEIKASFAIGVYPVTQQQWEAVMGNNPSRFSRGGGKDAVKGIADVDLWQFPVESVSWEDAEQFIGKLNARGGHWIYRLPTEAEWEYSCRGGATSQSDCSFHFYLDRQTNDLSSEQANFDGNNPVGQASKGKCLQRPTKVGAYKPNRLGLYDMHGNVWEWCADWYTKGSRRVLWGGSWNNSGQRCRAAGRFGLAPTSRNDDLGFRLARVPSSSK